MATTASLRFGETFGSAAPVRSPLWFAALVAVIAPLAGGQALENREDTSPRCATDILWHSKEAAAPRGIFCEKGDCDYASTRDQYIPGVGAEMLTIRLYFHVICDNEGADCAVAAQNLVDAVEHLNDNFMPYALQQTYLQFTYSVAYHNVSEYLSVPYQADGDAEVVIDMKNTYSVDPDSYLNVFVVTDITSDQGSYLGWATYPWDPDALQSTGGIVIRGLYLDESADALTEEVGHALGLWHIFHGVSELYYCIPCLNCLCEERAAHYLTPEGDTVGDLCSDTAAAPLTYECKAPTDDDCEGNSYPDAGQQHNFMQYASETCEDQFTPQQAGRMRCWFEQELYGWLDTDLPSLVSHFEYPFSWTSIELTFDEPMDVDTFTEENLYVTGSESGVHGFSVTYDGVTNTATVKPDTEFAPGETVTVELTNGLTDWAGNGLVPELIFSFQIEGTDCDLAYAEDIYIVGDDPYFVAVGDLNGDGDNDMVVPNSASDSVSVLLNTGSGTFATDVLYGAGDGPASVAIDDLDGDGDNDLAVSNVNGFNVSVLLNNGDGTFGADVLYGAGDAPWSVAIGDLDGDGDNDLATANAFSYNISVLLNNGNGTFSADVLYPAFIFPYSIVIGDLDGDGVNDLAVANQGVLSGDSDFVSVFRNIGNGIFAAQVLYGVGDAPFSIAIGDLDSDGDNDLATANGYSNNVSVLLNNGNGTFAADVLYGTGDRPLSVAMGDLDGDGDSDLATANWFTSYISILLNNGNGTFADDQQFDIAVDPYRLAIGNLDGDGNNDLVVVGIASSNVSVLLSACDEPDNDGDGVPDVNDECPYDPDKTEPGVCGCGVSDVDSDDGGTPDCLDACPSDPNKTSPGVCGCGVAETDSDADGWPDCIDSCPNDPNKLTPGLCGCGVPETDSDGDQTPDCVDGCPYDSYKTEPGICGCGTPDTDSDGDGTADCIDLCPDDPDKVDPGVCGCGVSDSDMDSDSVADCIDNCPEDPNEDQSDLDGDGVGDVCELPSSNGDADQDGDVDLIDYSLMGECIGGPGVPYESDCEAFDFDVDADVDLIDFGGFQVVFDPPCTQDCCGDDQECDDDEYCTVDSCVDGLCRNTSIPGCCNEDADCDIENGETCEDSWCVVTYCDEDADCDDGFFCTGTEWCLGNSCQAGVYPCNDESPVCDESTDSCLPCIDDAICDDGNICTNDACVQGVCEHVGVSGSCDDDDPCTDNDECVESECVGMPVTGCCTEDADCDIENGETCEGGWCSEP